MILGPPKGKSKQSKPMTGPKSPVKRGLRAELDETARKAFSAIYKVFATRDATPPGYPARQRTPWMLRRQLGPNSQVIVRAPERCRFMRGTGLEVAVRLDRAPLPLCPHRKALGRPKGVLAASSPLQIHEVLTPLPVQRSVRPPTAR